MIANSEQKALVKKLHLNPMLNTNENWLTQLQTFASLGLSSDLKNRVNSQQCTIRDAIAALHKFTDDNKKNLLKTSGVRTCYSLIKAEGSRKKAQRINEQKRELKLENKTYQTNAKTPNLQKNLNVMAALFIAKLQNFNSQVTLKDAIQQSIKEENQEKPGVKPEAIDGAHAVIPFELNPGGLKIDLPESKPSEKNVIEPETPAPLDVGELRQSSSGDEDAMEVGFNSSQHLKSYPIDDSDRLKLRSVERVIKIPEANDSHREVTKDCIEDSFISNISIETAGDIEGNNPQVQTRSQSRHSSQDIYVPKDDIEKPHMVGNKAAQDNIEQDNDQTNHAFQLEFYNALTAISSGTLIIGFIALSASFMITGTILTLSGAAGLGYSLYGLFRNEPCALTEQEHPDLPKNAQLG